MFITIEGGDGSGKSTLIARLTERITRSLNREIVTTREPGGIPIAEAIRAIILDRKNTEMDARTEALLYAAARRQHIAEKVVPALERGAVVICDRFVDSSLVYQGYARGLGIEAVWEINQFATEGCMPHLTLYLDVDPELGLARIESSGTREVNRLDLENLAFHQRVREGYDRVIGMFPDRIVKLDAAKDPQDLEEEAWRCVKQKLGLN
jgi:dTMP kinase